MSLGRASNREATSFIMCRQQNLATYPPLAQRKEMVELSQVYRDDCGRNGGRRRKLMGIWLERNSHEEQCRVNMPQEELCSLAGDTHLPNANPVTAGDKSPTPHIRFQHCAGRNNNSQSITCRQL